MHIEGRLKRKDLLHIIRIKESEKTKELIGVEIAFHNFLPRLESIICSVCFPQCEASNWEAQAANALIKFISFFLSLFLLIICQVPIKKTQMGHVSCKSKKYIVKNNLFLNNFAAAFQNAAIFLSFGSNYHF